MGFVFHSLVLFKEDYFVDAQSPLLLCLLFAPRHLEDERGP